MLKYIEHVDKLGHRGKAWIGLVTTSRSGRTVYFNGLALKRILRGGGSGNHKCVDTGDQYWVSGVKKSGTNRHWAGGGEILVEAAAVAELLTLKGWQALPAGYRVTHDIQQTDIQKFERMLNTATRDPDWPE